jgi:hypothetical protein
MTAHLSIADSGYHQLVIEEEDTGFRESFFNTVVDYPVSHANCQFRFSLPGQSSSDDYQRHISGFFRNEPCIYNHSIFGHAATLFEVMKHPPEAFQPGGSRLMMAVKKAMPPTGPQQAPRTKANRKHSMGITNSAILSSNSIRMRGDNGALLRLRNSNELELPDIDFASANEKRLTYQLVFQTLKCRTMHIISV